MLNLSRLFNVLLCKVLKCVDYKLFRIEDVFCDDQCIYLIGENVSGTCVKLSVCIYQKLASEDQKFSVVVYVNDIPVVNFPFFVKFADDLTFFSIVDVVLSFIHFVVCQISSDVLSRIYMRSRFICHNCENKIRHQ